MFAILLGGGTCVSLFTPHLVMQVATVYPRVGHAIAEWLSAFVGDGAGLRPKPFRNEPHNREPPPTRPHCDFNAATTCRQF